MSIICIKGGHVIDPATGRDGPEDIWMENGILIDKPGENLSQKAEIYDASGKIVCPGLVDIHVHFREPGQTHKETIQSGSWAAAAGGFTSVVCMPNTSPPCDNAGTIRYILDAIERSSVVRTYATGCLTVGMEGEKLAPIGSLKKAGVVAITDDGLCVQDNQIMRRVVEYAQMFQLPVLDHCQDKALTEGSVMNEGKVSLRLGLRGWPKAAEDIIVHRNVILSSYTGAHIHMQHISSEASVDIIRRAKSRGVKVTAEATPHHIALTDESLSTYNTNFKMNPPLRTEKDRLAIIEGLADGTLDCIGTDHAPHTDYEKDVEFDYAPFGIVGLETCLPVCLQILYRENGFSLSKVIDLLTRRPAQLLSLPGGTLQSGNPADVTVFDPDCEWTFRRDRTFSRSFNSPWLGKTLKGKVNATFVRGQQVFDGERILVGL